MRWPWQAPKHGRAYGLDEPLTHDAATVLDKSPAELYREQPHLRTVIDFLARNVAQLGLHVFERTDDDGRERVRDGGLAALLARPNPHQTTYELVYGIVASLALYGRSLTWVGVDESGQPGALWPIAEQWVVDTRDSTAFAVGVYVIEPNDSGRRIEIPADQVIELRAWHPTDQRVGSSPVLALKSILSEQIHAQTFREQLWQNGGRVGSYITRPAEAPDWSNEARARFKGYWKAVYTGDGRKVGGVPILEEGMQLHRLGFSAKDEDYVEGTKLALTTVASVYQVNPTMVGVLDNANYSNVREFRRMLYGDTLGPILKQIEARLNAFLVPRFADTGDQYVEFNVRQKLEGSTEQMEQYVAAVREGILTPGEVRSMMNRPHIEGSDHLRLPAGVTVAQSDSDSGVRDEAEQAGGR
ncbi:phage portal protein [Gordonia sp. NPDC062954]|uniref:phage portal protein n=1 Tax=Gordonia sp. NPDC062954 TaxID=3364003 RepID=UPI0037CBADD2